MQSGYLISSNVQISMIYSLYETNRRDERRNIISSKKCIPALYVIILLIYDLAILGSWNDILEFYFIFFFCIVINQLEQFIIDEILKVILDFHVDVNKCLAMHFNSLKKDVLKIQTKLVRNVRICNVWEIKDVKDQYNFIWNLSLEANKLFSFQQLFALVSTVCLIILYVYYFLHLIKKKNDEILWISLHCLFWIAYLFLTVFYLLRGWCYIKHDVRTIISFVITIIETLSNQINTINL